MRIYSIDEAFLGVRGTLPELQQLARRMKQDVMDHLGLPVCVGITKTTGGLNHAGTDRPAIPFSRTVLDSGITKKVTGAGCILIRQPHRQMLTGQPATAGSRDTA